MSEFFKALEQAERDRVRQDHADAPAAPPLGRTAPKETGAPAPDPVVARPAVVAKPAVAKTVKPPAARPPAPPQAPPLVVVPEPAPAPPAEPAAAEALPSPASVFRPSLRSRDRFRVNGRANGRYPLLIAQTDPSSVEADAYRTVRANIELMSDNGASRHIAITSAAGGDGKSTTAANLAVVAAQGGRRVCLVDADFRRPILHDVFGLSNVDGLALALEQGRTLQSVARPSAIDNLSVVVAGRSPDEGFHDLLTPQRLESVLRDSGAAFDVVLFDSPPVVLADALSVASVCDGVILVVRAGGIPFGVLRRAIGQIGQVKGRILGVLLNQANLKAANSESHGYYRAYDAVRPKS